MKHHSRIQDRALTAMVVCAVEATLLTSGPPQRVSAAEEPKGETRKEAQIVSGAHVPNLSDYATVETTCEGVPVYAFGYTYVYGLSPDVQPGVKLQEGNNNPWVKLKPKKSWEIKNNKLGSTPAREPKTAANDLHPVMSINLIDGDPTTAWCSRGQVEPDVEPVWIRIDLPVESRIGSVTLVPHERGIRPQVLPKGCLPVGQAFPRKLEIKVSRDAWHWETVYRNDQYAAPGEMKPQEFTFDPRLAKQIWIIGQDLPRVLNFGHCFSIASVEVKDERGQNLALVSRGAGVTVSSTHLGHGMDRFTQEMLWPIQYDLGFKWSRVGYTMMSVFSWSYVEQEKGTLRVDPQADAAITEAVNNGVNVIMTLDQGNWLYAPEVPKKDHRWELLETYYELPPAPTVAPDYLQGYLNYVRYMVRHFKDRVKYFEIWNEWNGSAEEYARLAKAAIPVIREEYPQAKIMAMSTGGFNRKLITGYLKEGLGPLIDVIAWHPFYQDDPLKPAYVNYPNDVKELKKVCESQGFKGEYMATEWDWSAPYPPDRSQRSFVVSELVKAKYALGLMIRHVGLDMVSLWNETFQTQFVSWSISLLRNTFTADPIPPTQPEPVYYALRTLSTVLEDVKPMEMAVEFSEKTHAFETWGFARGQERLLAFWVSGRAEDISAETRSDIVLPGQRYAKAVGIDLLNGREQELLVAHEGNATVLRGMLIKDFPVLVRLR